VGVGFTITVADRVVDPPLPVQVTAYVVVAAGETETDPETLVGEKPVPLQAVASVDDHDSVDEAPETMDPGLAPIISVGAVGDTAARPVWTVHPVRSSLNTACHHVSPLALAGPPTTAPWFPSASTPIGGVLFDGVE
jgi:hypothetical protein